MADWQALRALPTKEHKQQDTGGTARFIFTPGGEVFADRSAHDREWITVNKELRPLFLEALETAWQRGFLLESRDLADYRLTGMNLGWQVPGIFNGTSSHFLPLNPHKVPV